MTASCWGLCFLLSYCLLSSCGYWFIFLTFSAVSLLSALSLTVFVFRASVCVSLRHPHPLFALSLCPLTAQTISALSSHPIDFCGLFTPPLFVPPLLPLFCALHTHAHPFPPGLYETSHFNVFYSSGKWNRRLQQWFPPSFCSMCIITHNNLWSHLKKFHYHRHNQSFLTTHYQYLSYDLTSCWTLWAVHQLEPPLLLHDTIKHIHTIFHTLFSLTALSFSLSILTPALFITLWL